ncbi:MAG: calcium-binding protein [Hyphomicrobiaceae bacterium]|nr:MAG: calcium-binding protein [Hyphomicrobiaceae bacterium]
MILLGNGKDNKLSGLQDTTNELWGNGGNDSLHGQNLNDLIMGGGGNDSIWGNGGDDILFGGSTKISQINTNKIVIGQDYDGKVIFEGEGAGYKNTFGVYTIDANGNISDVKVLFANASLKGSGGGLSIGDSINLALKAGQKLGFFILPDGYSGKSLDGKKSVNNADIFARSGGHYELRDADTGKQGTINDGPVNLYWVDDATGKAILLKGAYGGDTFHSIDGAENGLNPDKFNHVKSTVDVVSGKITIAFEDLKNGGDKDFDDVKLTLDLGTPNALLLPKLPTDPSKPKSEDKDVIYGGDGNDQLYGMADDDQLHGGLGNDKLWGNSGKDVLWGNEGNDELHGGQGDDVLNGGIGDDKLFGDTGNDLFIAKEGNDTVDGGKGFDTLDYSDMAVKSGITVDFDKSNTVKVMTADGLKTDKVVGIEKVVGTDLDDKFTGDKNDNVFVGGGGNDWFRGMGGKDTFTGGEGKDTFSWNKKDVSAKASDVITDFSVGEDKLEFADFMKSASQVDKYVKLVGYDTTDDLGSIHHNTMIKVSTDSGKTWVEVVSLVDVDASQTVNGHLLNAHDLGL